MVIRKQYSDNNAARTFCLCLGVFFTDVSNSFVMCFRDPIINGGVAWRLQPSAGPQLPNGATLQARVQQLQRGMAGLLSLGEPPAAAGLVARRWKHGGRG